MRLDLDRLPTDIVLLHRVVRDLAATVERQDQELKRREDELETLRLLLAKLKRLRFGRSSEKRDPDQLQLALEAIEAEIAAREAARPPAAAPCDADRSLKPVRRPLPAHLPRAEVRHEPEGCACPCCGGPLHEIGADVSEVLDWEPARFKVIRHVRPRLACRACETVTQMPAPSLPIERGRPGPGLLAQVLVAKYCDHQPLYRQSAIYARGGVELERSTLAGWVGRACWLLTPLGAALGRHVMAGAKLHADDTPVPVLDPGRGRTKTGRLWVYVRDDRNSGDRTPPAALFRYSPDRKGARPADHLKDFGGYLQADAYAGWDRLYRDAGMIEVGCWAHARRKIFELYEATRSPVAAEALDKIGALYEIENRIRGKPPDRRRAARQEHAVALLDALKRWLEAQLARLAPRSSLAGAFRYVLAHWAALTHYPNDGRLEIDNNRAENVLRGVALGRKNWLFAGSDTGGTHAALVYSLIETCKLNGLDPYAYLRDTLGGIADHPIRRIDELLPWRWAATQTAAVA
ncbi:MAG: IS66 family transposase [Proteobacteria bacterium]|nr:IS66 family transposase [Pseudomonadota bacterium]